MLTVLDCAWLIDGTDSEPIRDARIVFQDGRVTAVGDQDEITVPDALDEDDHHEFPEETILPGLIDAHVHLIGARSVDPLEWVTMKPSQSAARATVDLRALLAAGFTTVRDVGSNVAIGLREAVREGELPGPHIYTSGQTFSQTGGHGDVQTLPYEWAISGVGSFPATLVDGKSACRAGARKRIREGVDCFKIMATGGVLTPGDHPSHSQFTREEIAVFVDEAHRVDIPVASHAQGEEGIINSLECGVDTIEHGFEVTDAAVNAFHDAGAVYVPTYSVMHRICEHGEEHGVPPYALEKSRNARESHLESIRRAYAADVPIALGTDFLGPDLLAHGDNALEAELLVEVAGLSEHDAIRAGTGVAARTLPDSDLGTLESGNRADAVVLAGDPLSDIGELRSIVEVYKDGRPVEIG